jgi:rhamnosyltransferase
LRKVGMVALSVLLLTKNGGRDVERLLPKLYDQKGVGSLEVIAVDSGSTDGTIDLLQRHPLHLEQIPAEAFHHARTRNFAASLARGEVLIFLSQDAIPASSHWLSNLISNFDDEKVGAVYGRQIPKPGSFAERQETMDTVYGAHRIVKDPAHRNGLGYRFYLFSSVNAAIRRSVWQATRFPEELKVFEDLGIAKRILDGGWKIVYEPQAAVHHSHNHSTLGLFRRYFDIGYTLKRLEIWDAPGTRKSLWRDGCKMLKKKIGRSRDVSIKRSPGDGIQEDIAKSVGLFLGLNQACLPLILKRHLSAYRVFG